MYNPELARYMQPDPIGVNSGMNIYSYVENNPLNMNDPAGLIPSLPENFVNVVGAVGDGILNTLSFGLINGKQIRSFLNIDGNIRNCGTAYNLGYMGGMLLTNAAYLGGAIPNQLVHYTTKEGTAGIAKIQQILPSKSGLTGKGVYTTSINNNPSKLGKAFLGDVFTKNIPIVIENTSGFQRIIPNLIYMKGNNIQLPSMILTYDYLSNALNESLYNCGCN